MKKVLAFILVIVCAFLLQAGLAADDSQDQSRLVACASAADIAVSDYLAAHGTAVCVPGTYFEPVPAVTTADYHLNLPAPKTTGGRNALLLFLCLGIGAITAPLSFMNRKSLGRFFAKWLGGNLVFYPGSSGYGNEWFCDSVNGASTNTGKSWEQALDTIAAAVALASAGDTINMRGSFSEAVVSAVIGLRFIGCGSVTKEAQWTADADEICLTLSAAYQEVNGIYFRPPAYTAGSPAAITLSGADWAFIHHCRFQGKTASHQAIHSPVADSDNVEISDCQFYYMNTATYGCGILGVAAAGAGYNGWRILRNVFSGCVSGVVVPARVFVVEGNSFPQYGIAANGNVGAVCTAPLNLSGTDTGGNIVRENTMDGDYSNTGGYTAGTAGDCWTGNYATDVAEAEVGDNGITLAAPAA